MKPLIEFLREKGVNVERRSEFIAVYIAETMIHAGLSCDDPDVIEAFTKIAYAMNKRTECVVKYD